MLVSVQERMLILGTRSVVLQLVKDFRQLRA